jgi:hypothetical protein
MKTRKFLYSFAAAAALLMGTTSCSDFLDTPTDTRVELTTTEQLRMLLNSGYPTSNYAWPCELMSDNMEDNNAPDADGLRYNLSSYNRGDDEMFRWEQCASSTSNDTPSDIWEGFYGSIANANAVLEVLDKWEAENGKLDDTQKAIRGEALVLRAFGHFILAQVFCEPYHGKELSKSALGIPYITTPEVTVKPHYERGTLADTYEKIEADLTEGLPLISNSLYSVPKYHFNTAAAYAFAARFYLFTRQYQKAYDYANLAFGGEGTDASTYMSDVWSKLGDFYYVSDFGLYQNSIDKQSNFLLYPTYSIEFRRFYGSRRYAVIRDALNATIHGSSPVWGSFTWKNSNGKGSSFTMHPCFNGSCISNGNSEYGTANIVNVQEQFEYTDKVSGIGYAHVTRREFYGEETLLTRAEARLFLGDVDGAIADLTIWEKARRSCPGASGNENLFVDLTLQNITAFYQTKDPGYGIAKEIHIDEICPESDAKVSTASIMPVLQCIQHFRRIETIHTGMRWFDIKRYGLEFDRLIGKDGSDHLSINDPRKAMQIPSEVISAGMEANPRMEGDGSLQSMVEYAVPAF